jgi:hypothetical protein
MIKTWRTLERSENGEKREMVTDALQRCAHLSKGYKILGLSFRRQALQMDKGDASRSWRLL